MDPVMVLSYNLGLDINIASQVSMAMVAAWLSDINMGPQRAAKTQPSVYMAFCDNTGHRNKHRPHLQEGHRPRYGPWQPYSPGHHMSIVACPSPPMHPQFCLHSARTTPFLPLTHFSTTYLLIMVAPTCLGCRSQEEDLCHNVNRFLTLYDCFHFEPI